MYKNIEDGEKVTHLSTEEARSGSTPHIARHVLGWGLALVIAAFVVILAVGML